MPNSDLYRIGGLSAIAGAILTAIGNALFPRASDPTDLSQVVQAMASYGPFVVLSWITALGLLLILGGLAVLALSLRDSPGEGWARLAFYTAIVATALWVVVFAVNVGASWLADAATRDASLTPVAKAMVFQVNGLFAAAVLVNWLDVFLFGVALLRTDRYPLWLAWTAVVLGGGTFLFAGLPLALSGVTAVVDNVVFPILATLTLVWLLVLGVFLWRRAGLTTSTSPSTSSAR